VFDRIHYSGRIHCSFGRFIGKFGRFIGKIVLYSSVGDFTIHIFNQMDFDRFLPIFIEFDRFFFQKPTGSEGADFSVSAGFFNTSPEIQLVAFFFPFASAVTLNCHHFFSYHTKATRGRGTGALPMINEPSPCYIGREIEESNQLLLV
jgi:hypothetical protein